jgi:hypothetical protein
MRIWATERAKTEQNLEIAQAAYAALLKGESASETST